MTTPPGAAVKTAAVQGINDVLIDHFDRAPVGMILFAADRTILQVNRAVAEHTGLAPGILRGAPLQRFLFSDSPEGLEDRIFEEVALNGSWLGQLDVRTSVADASPMMLSVTAVAPTTEGPVRYIGTITELGQQRWIEAESSRRAAELSAISALAVATGSSVEPTTMLLAAARQIVEGLEVDACWIHRYEAADGGRLALAGEASYLHPTLRLSPRMIPDAINPGVLRAIETREQVVTSELLDRSIATVVHAPLLAAGDVVGVISILSVEGEKLATRNSELLRAVTYQLGTAIQNVRLLEALTVHQAELEEKNQELERLVEELRAADRLKSEFLANTSHELRTPLNSIIGFLNLVQDGVCESDEERQELLGHALRSAKHLLGLINDVLDLARIEAGSLQVDCREVDLAPILSEVQATMEVQARQKYLDFIMGDVPVGTRVLGGRGEASPGSRERDWECHQVHAEGPRERDRERLSGLALRGHRRGRHRNRCRGRPKGPALQEVLPGRCHHDAEIRRDRAGSGDREAVDRGDGRVGAFGECRRRGRDDRLDLDAPRGVAASDRLRCGTGSLRAVRYPYGRVTTKISSSPRPIRMRAGRPVVMFDTESCSPSVIVRSVSG